MAPTTPNYKVELHVHLDGCFRADTVIEFAHKRHIAVPLPRDKFIEATTIQQPNSLPALLECFPIFMAPIVGCADAIERIAFEYVEDCFRQGVYYAEPRCSVHLLSDTFGKTQGDSLDPSAVLELMLKAEACQEVLRLVEKHPNAVAIDIAGPEFLAPDFMQTIFQEAARLNIHRTTHAGEVGGPEIVDQAINVLGAERLGHGYHCIDKTDTYEAVTSKRIHLECCPFSSILTGAVKSWDNHPIKKFAADGVNFGISTDDPYPLRTNLFKEYKACTERLGLPPTFEAKCNFNAANSAFCSPDEKKGVLARLHEVFGSGDC